ncbi:MAG: hypothetical protein V1660_01950 [archaeon]
MGKSLEGLAKKGVLVAGLGLKGAAIYVAYVQGGEHFFKKEYSEAARYFFFVSAPLGITANLFLGTSGVLYIKGIMQKLRNRNGKNKYTCEKKL